MSSPHVLPEEVSALGPSGLFAGRYRTEAQLGRGTFGVVYRAFDTRLKRSVALKLPHRLLASDPEFLKAFAHEAQTAAALNHPNIVTIYDVGETEDGLPYLAMRFLEGRSLRQLLLDQGPPRTEHALGILDQLAAALDYLQSRQLVHRDIKPANVMVSGDHQATLMDFGLARSLTGTHLTLSGALAFTPLYASPEQVVGERLTAASDRYSFAVVVYETLTGRAPHASFDSQVLLHAIRFEPPVPPDEINRSLPPGVGPVLLAALAKRPEERPPSAEQLMQDLRRSIEQAEGKRRNARATPLPEGPDLPSRPARARAAGPASPAPPVAAEPELEPESDGNQQILPTRRPKELARYAAAGIKLVEVFGRSRDVCYACAITRSRTYAIESSPPLPVPGCTSRWGCHCEFAPLPEEGQTLPKSLLALLNPGQHSRLDLLRLRRARAQGEGDLIQIISEAEACRVCREASRVYKPEDTPTLPLYDCRRYPPCSCSYQLLPAPSQSSTFADAIRQLDAKIKSKGWPWQWR